MLLLHLKGHHGSGLWLFLPDLRPVQVDWGQLLTQQPHTPRYYFRLFHYSSDKFVWLKLVVCLQWWRHGQKVERTLGCLRWGNRPGQRSLEEEALEKRKIKNWLVQHRTSVCMDPKNQAFCKWLLLLLFLFTFARTSSQNYKVDDFWWHLCVVQWESDHTPSCSFFSLN